MSRYKARASGILNPGTWFRWLCSDSEPRSEAEQTQTSGNPEIHLFISIALKGLKSKSLGNINDQPQTPWRGLIPLPWVVTSGRPSCNCEEALPGGRGVKWGRSRSESSRGRCGPGPESVGSWPGRWHLPPGSYPREQQGPHWRVTFLHLGPQGTRQFSAQSHRLASPFLLLCHGVSAQT